MSENTQIEQATAEKDVVKAKPAKKAPAAKKASTANQTAPEAASPKQAKAKASKKQPRRPSISERIERQANPTTRLAGQQKTILLHLDYNSDIIHEYLRLNQATMLSAYERLAALMRMLSREKNLLAHVNEWINLNMEIAQSQLHELQAMRSTLEEQSDITEIPEIKTPESYKTTFEASHPVANKMLTIARAVDAELVACETLYFAGAIDDNEYTKLRDQTTVIIRGSVDRIYKATSPGNREGGRFNPADLAKWIREGNRMMFADVTQNQRQIVEAFNAQNPAEETAEVEVKTEQEAVEVAA